MCEGGSPAESDGFSQKHMETLSQICRTHLRYPLSSSSTTSSRFTLGLVEDSRNLSSAATGSCSARGVPEDRWVICSTKVQISEYLPG